MTRVWRRVVFPACDTREVGSAVRTRPLICSGESENLDFVMLRSTPILAGALVVILVGGVYYATRKPEIVDETPRAPNRNLDSVEPREEVPAHPRPNLAGEKAEIPASRQLARSSRAPPKPAAFDLNKAIEEWSDSFFWEEMPVDDLPEPIQHDFSKNDLILAVLNDEGREVGRARYKDYENLAARQKEIAWELLMKEVNRTWIKVQYAEQRARTGNVIGAAAAKSMGLDRRDWEQSVSADGICWVNMRQLNDSQTYQELLEDLEVFKEENGQVSYGNPLSLISFFSITAHSRQP